MWRISNPYFLPGVHSKGKVWREMGIIGSAICQSITKTIYKPVCSVWSESTTSRPQRLNLIWYLRHIKPPLLTELTARHKYLSQLIVIIVELACFIHNKFDHIQGWVCRFYLYTDTWVIPLYILKVHCNLLHSGGLWYDKPTQNPTKYANSE